MTTGSVWEMQAFDMIGINTLAMPAGSSIYKECATNLTYSTLSPALGNIYNGTFGSTISVASNGAVNEGVTSVMTVTVSPVNCAATTFNYATSDGTAIAGQNYTTTSGSTSVPANTATMTINVPTIDDNKYEAAMN
jgi:hypothetical protein